MSRVTCHVSYVTCHMSHVRFFSGQIGEASQGRVCYQRGLPRLVFNACAIKQRITTCRGKFAKIIIPLKATKAVKGRQRVQ